MTDFISHFWNGLHYSEIGLLVVGVFAGVILWRLKSGARCPQCGSRFEKVDGRPSLNQRLMNMISINGKFDAELEDETYYKCTSCTFKTDNVIAVALKQRHSDVKPADSKTTSFK